MKPAQPTSGTMAAMIGGSDEDVARLASDCDVDVANLNCPGPTCALRQGGRNRHRRFKSQRVWTSDGQEAESGRSLPLPPHGRSPGTARRSSCQQPNSSNPASQSFPIFSPHHPRAQMPSGPLLPRSSHRFGALDRIDPIAPSHRVTTSSSNSGPEKFLAGFMARIDKEARIHFHR